MTALRQVLGRTTQEAAFGLAIVLTACYLAITGAITGDAFLGLAIVVVGAVYKSQAKTNGQ